MIRTAVARATRPAISPATTGASAVASTSSHPSVSTTPPSLSKPPRLPSTTIRVSHFPPPTNGEGIGKIIRSSLNGRGDSSASCLYECPSFRLEARRYTAWQARLFPPFLPTPPAKETHTRSKLREAQPGMDARTVELLTITSKKRISNDAVKRNRASRRVFWAIKWCLQRGGAEGATERLHDGLTRADDVLLAAHINREALDAPMAQLVGDAEKALLRVRPSPATPQVDQSSPAHPRLPSRSYSGSATTRSSNADDVANPAEGSSSARLRFRRPRDTAAPPPPKKGKRPPPWTPSDSLGETQHWICIKGMPITATTADVVRVLDSATLRDGSGSSGGSSSSSAASSTPTGAGLSRYISDVLPVYRTTSLRTTDRFLLRLLHQRHEDVLLRHLDGRLYAGHDLSAHRCTAEGAATLLGSNLIACSSRAYDARAHGSVTDFVRAIVARSSSNGDSTATPTNKTASSTYSSHGSGGAGSVVLLRGLPPGVRPELLVRRFGRRYTLAAPGGPRNRTSLWDRTQGTWSPVQLEQVIQLWVANSGSDAREARREAEMAMAASSADQQGASASASAATVEALSNWSSKTSMFLVRMGSAAHAHALLRRLHGRRWSTLPASVRYGGSSGEWMQSFGRAEHPEDQGLLREMGDRDAESDDADDDDDASMSLFGGHDSLLEQVDEDGVPLYGRGEEGEEDGGAHAAARTALNKAKHRARPGEVVSGMREYTVEVQVMY